MRKSQKLLVGLASLTLWDIAVASAADLPVKAQPPAPVATYNWSGFYVGVHAGYRWADASFSGPGFRLVMKAITRTVGLLAFRPGIIS